MSQRPDDPKPNPSAARSALPPSLRRGRASGLSPGATGAATQDPSPDSAPSPSPQANVEASAPAPRSSEPPAGRSQTLMFDPGVFSALRKQNEGAPPVSPASARETIHFGRALEDLARERQSAEAGAGAAEGALRDDDELSFDGDAEPTIATSAETMWRSMGTGTVVGLPVTSPSAPPKPSRESGKPSTAARTSTAPGLPTPQITQPPVAAPPPSLPEVAPAAAPTMTFDAWRQDGAQRVVQTRDAAVSPPQPNFGPSSPPVHDQREPKVPAADTFVGSLPDPGVGHRQSMEAAPSVAPDSEEGIVLNLPESLPEGGDTAVVAPGWADVHAAPAPSQPWREDVREDTPPPSQLPQQWADPHGEPLSSDRIRVPVDPVREKTVLTKQAVLAKPPGPASINAPQEDARQIQILAKPDVSDAPAWAHRTRATVAGAPPSPTTAPASRAEPAPSPLDPAVAAAPASASAATWIGPSAGKASRDTASPIPPAPAVTAPAGSNLGAIGGLAALLFLAAFAIPRTVEGGFVAPWNDLTQLHAPSLQALVFFVLVAALSFPKGGWRAPVLAVTGILALAGASLAWREAHLTQVFRGHPAVNLLFGGAVQMTALLVGGAVLLCAASWAHTRRGHAAAALLGGAGAVALGLGLFASDWVGGPGSAPFDQLLLTIKESELRGDRVGALATLVFLGTALVGLCVGFLGRPGALLAGLFGGVAQFSLVALPFIMAAHVSRDIFTVLEPVKLAALMAAVLLLVPFALATASTPDRRAVN